MEKEFTATTYIIDGDRFLLLYHAKLAKWLPPGGHIELNETPVEAARREAKEETGLDVVFIKQENIWIDRWNATSFERPYMCLLENIPEYKDRPAHQHVDFIYLSKPLDALQTIPENCRWWSWEQLEQLKPDVDIFQETLDVIKGILG